MGKHTDVTIEPMAVIVLAGGKSAERDISLESGTAVAAALASRGHHVTTVDPAETDLTQYNWSGTDAVFVALHGTFGEDGQVQSIMEEARIPFTGSDSAASRLAFSKSASKERFVQQNVPTPAYVLIHESDDGIRIDRQARKIGHPLIVKPDAQGSSLGVSLVEEPGGLPRALTECFHYDTFGMLETAIAGSEWTVGFLDDLAMPLIKIETGRTFFDFKAKYSDETTSYQFEFSLPTNVVRSIEQAARDACQALGTSGLTRVDLRLDRQNRPWVLEVNTVPGLTAHSLVPKAAAQMGIDLGELCERALAGCLEKSAVRIND
ncbi:MAG: D-alanine--D-alanine ligase [Planctomycetaceae bacterium]|jgi:D-alanine-D-alanine ligase|nr:D-alanine--D-alanine ligase [Planctomycetaceae bacterium]MBT6487491.1 D-alanine--D-alanine ligase [Planctomycetaceae bacterium]MBT6495882.1 D-alanine--D-alanine ligase [Planctomycetaceae bacterium]